MSPSPPLTLRQVEESAGIGPSGTTGSRLRSAREVRGGAAGTNGGAGARGGGSGCTGARAAALIDGGAGRSRPPGGPRSTTSSRRPALPSIGSFAAPPGFTDESSADGRSRLLGAEGPPGGSSPVPKWDAGDSAAGTCSTAPQLGQRTRPPIDSSRTRNGL